MCLDTKKFSCFNFEHEFGFDIVTLVAPENNISAETWRRVGQIMPRES